MASVTAPLEGVRVLDFCHFLAGPYATWILAELGADVIKIEDPAHPDEARSVGPYFQGGRSLYFAALNGGKRSVAVQFDSALGRTVIDRLIASSDVVVSNWRPGVMRKLGLSPDAVALKNRQVITCSLTSFGEEGPYAPRPGYDYTIQAISGVMGMTGEPDGPPGKAGISYVDHSGGLTAALAVCAALVQRDRTGVGGHIDLALFDIQVSMLSYLAAWHLNAGYESTRTAAAAHPSIVPAQNFETSDGFISLFVGNDAMWHRFISLFNDSVLADVRFSHGAERNIYRVELLERLQNLLRLRTTTEWVGACAELGVPCAPVNTLAEALADRQVSARGLVRESEGPVLGRYRYVGGPLPKMGASRRPAPEFGEHTAQVLDELGVDVSTSSESRS